MRREYGMMRLGRAVAVGAALAGALAWVAMRGVARVQAADRTAAYHAQASSSAAPTIQVYARETVADVTVIDEKGQPVRGLTKADFTVEQDGKPQAIRGFDEFDSAARAAAVAAPEKLPPNVYSNAQAAAPATGPVTRCS
jgi:hypothetical protein